MVLKASDRIMLQYFPTESLGGKYNTFINRDKFRIMQENFE